MDNVQSSGKTSMNLVSTNAVGTRNPVTPADAGTPAPSFGVTLADIVAQAATPPDGTTATATSATPQLTADTAVSSAGTGTLAERQALQTTAEWLMNTLLQSLPVPGLDSTTSDPFNSSSTSSSTNGWAALTSSTSTDSTSLLDQLLTSAGTGNLDTSNTMGAILSGTLDSALNGTAPAAATTSSATITDAINQASARYGVPTRLIRGVIEQESGMNTNAVSSAGALGLMQLMPATAQALGVQNPLDPSQNIDGGTRYLASLLQQFNGDSALALAAYNAGPNAVRQYGGIPPYPETQQYVRNVLALAQRAE